MFNCFLMMSWGRRGGYRGGSCWKGGWLKESSQHSHLQFDGFSFEMKVFITHSLHYADGVACMADVVSERSKCSINISIPINRLLASSSATNNFPHTSSRNPLCQRSQRSRGWRHILHSFRMFFKLKASSLYASAASHWVSPASKARTMGKCQQLQKQHQQQQSSLI